MKKILSILIFTTLFISILTGCKQDDNTANVIAKSLDNNLNKLSVVVNKLDSIDNKYLYNPDIYSSINNLNNNQNNKHIALTFNQTNSDIIAKENVKQSLINKITNKLESQGYSSSDCYTCKKYCDENGNCYYTDCNGNNYSYNNNGDCYECESIPTTCSYIGEKDIFCNDCNSLDIEKISITSDQESVIDKNTTLNDQEIKNNESNSSESLSTPRPTVKMFYFTQDSFSPVKLKYNPRYINQYNENTINDQIETYLYKVQKLYAMSEDSIEANTILQNCKLDLLGIIKDIKDLNICIINGECEPTIQELQALNNYITDIKTTTKRLKDCKGELLEEINSINESNSSSNSMISSVDVMNSNYMRLINHIDTRITYHKSAIATLEQIKHLLNSSINGNNISNEELENIIENLTTEEPKNNENDLANDQINTEEDGSESNANIVEDLNINEHNMESFSQYTADTNMENNKTNNDNDLIDNNNEILETNSEEIQSSDVENEETDSTINSYNATPSWSNVDTYRDKKNNDINHDLNTIDAENIDEDIVTNNNNNVNYETTYNDNDTVDDNIDTESNNENIVQNNTLTNQSTNIINDEIYNNSIITQNNLNNNDGYGGYYYTSDGNIKNNGVNNNNEVGNNGNTIENNLNRNNNVNTYGYNTLLDIINQGTVNNGINTL